MPDKDHWAHKAIDWAITNGITAGTSDTTFSPDTGCTRAQVVTFLWKAAGSPESSGTAKTFGDVKAGSYYEKAVSWAVENGITAGT
ncbi:MAG: S-layer homology domain-containing protein, partial [Clostridia bacterium]|nr:S-layer homology domain-containing protein [Clostridia bacterium]